MVRRSFGTIHAGHLPEDNPDLDDFWNELEDRLTFDLDDYTAGAFALEEGDEKKRRHIQFYVEHSRKRPSTLAKDFGVITGAVFDYVRNASAAWDYCTGTGTHEGKDAIERFQFGSPKLHGDTQKADLKLMVGLILDGATPYEILESHPYAYCVHRRRIWDLWSDLADSKIPANRQSGMVGWRNGPT